MDRSRITITWEELQSPQVEKRLERQQAASRTREHYERQASRAPDHFAAPSRWSALLYNTVFYMAAFGLVGGLLGWGLGEIVLIRPDYRADELRLRHSFEITLRLAQAGAMPVDLAEARIKELQQEGMRNPYFRVNHDGSLSDAEKTRLLARERNKDFVANIIFYGACGITLALFLSIADAVMSRNIHGAIIYGSVGALLGLVGGVTIALFIHKIFDAIRGDAEGGSSRQLLARAISFGVMGLFLTVAPGLVLRNTKRCLIGMAGGLLGGVIGGVLFDLITSGQSDYLARLTALVAIGAISGAGTGLIEMAAKAGWLKVTAGVIAGKQFILYRNPTYIGSSPNSEIYLFKDPEVGKRHAAIHIVQGGFDLENLPLGAPTLLNGRAAVARARLHPGDEIQVGSTSFMFQEKAKPGH